MQQDPEADRLTATNTTELESLSKITQLPEERSLLQDPANSGATDTKLAGTIGSISQFDRNKEGHTTMDVPVPSDENKVRKH